MNGICLFLLITLAMPHALWARGGGGCLAEGTRVLTPSGPVPIETLATGDDVWAVVDGRLRPATVQALIRVQPDDYIELELSHGRLEVTREHPVQVAAGVFRQAAFLRAGDILWRWRDERLNPTRVLSVQTIPARRPAYNLIVAPGGTFLAEDVVVHNKGCFLPDTTVLRSDGTLISIAAVKPGEVLLAFTAEGTVVQATVRQVLTRDVENYVVVTTETRILHVTPEHPFYVGEGTFKTLEALRVGDRVFVFDGQGLSPQTIAGLEMVRKPARVYNLQTDAPHTFFANGIAVHNKGGGCFPAGTRIGTPEGEVTIEQLKPGHSVWSVTRNGRWIASPVQATHATRSLLLVLDTDQGELRTTLEHPLRLAQGGFQPAGELRRGDRLLVWRQGRWRAARVQSRFEGAVPEPLFNITVGGPHTFLADGFVAHNKGGGGGFHGSHGDGGTGTDDPQAAIIAIAFIVFFVAVIVIANAKKKRDENLDFVYSASAIAAKAAKTEKLLEFIAKVDPAFAPESLRQWAQQTFVRLQECWQARAYGPMQSLLMPDLYAQHCAQLSAMIRQHEINVIAGAQVEEVDLVNVRYPHAEHTREFTALITARARDYYVDDRTQQFLRGDEAPARFQEFWTFQRQEGKWLLREIEQTRESDKLKEENFFEPFTDEGRQQVYDETANAGGPSGPWLDKEIATKATRIERLLNFLVLTDKLWDRAAMIQRARQVFVEIMSAFEAGDPARIPADAVFPEVAATINEAIQQARTEGRTVEYRNLCVRKVELILARNYADNARDEFTARVSAHAQYIERKQATIVRQDEDVSPFVEYFVFGRMDGQWKLKEILPDAQGESQAGQENVDEESSADQLQWYYQHTRAN